MDSNVDPSVQRLIDLTYGSFGVLAGVIFFVWLLIALLAAAVAPNDRPWSFFWCTFLLLGPIGVALALVAPARPQYVNHVTD